jgi:nicotinate phosphoribosyltransferase
MITAKNERTTLENHAANDDLLNTTANAADRTQLTVQDYVSRLPEFTDPYADKYFLRAHEILSKEGINPYIMGQVMIRKGPGVVSGMNEALAVFEKYINLAEHGGSLKALPEGSSYESQETLMHFVAPVLDVVKYETLYLGILAAETTRANSEQKSIDLMNVKNRMRAVVDAADGRPVMYFGARHWRYDDDAAISSAAFAGGATSCSTDNGASRHMPLQLGVGTVPHVLENVMAFKYGRERAVVEAIKAFDKHIEKSVPRIALIDYDNREITRSIECAAALKAQDSKLDAVRVDTCGENLAEGALGAADLDQADAWKAKYNIAWTPGIEDPDSKYWYGNGVTVSGVLALRRSLDQAGFRDVRIVLSSGFGDAEKVKAFVRAEKRLGIKLFDSLGVGGVFDSWHSKMDVVAVGDTPGDLQEISKTGRGMRANPRLEKII